MSRITNPFEIYKILPQTNCGECTLPNCLAFSAAIIKGQKQLADCPYIKTEDRKKLADRLDVREDFNRTRGEDLENLKSMIRTLDFSRFFLSGLA